jgi:serine/threonine protein kinase
MTSLDQYVGQVLDEKYRLEKLLGQGGMGAVYLATHLGTERFVALKLIAPQFMRNEEFVQRFKREARAAGRLRHPNVVDVTDFGFAQANNEPVAYLIMEYLDGCTLGDILREEKRLPLEWVVDILEQVCSAVQEAHQQGIIHRDLKPENIWLEPNRLGSYRVKVLDFGIAKVAGGEAQAGDDPQIQTGEAESRSLPPPHQLNPRELETDTLLYNVDERPEGNLEAATMVPRPKEAEATQLFASKAAATQAAGAPLFSSSREFPNEDGKTLRLDQATRHHSPASHGTLTENTAHGAALTRVGAIMGTPIYMSPEQCAAKSLDARSDVYSLGVIAYQMLTGDPPFSGDTAAVIRGHLESSPPDLQTKTKKLPKRVANVIMSSLAKTPADRPQTAAAFGTSLRAQAEGIGALYRRAFALYSEYFPKFVKISFLAHVPAIVFTFILIGFQFLLERQPKGLHVTKIAVLVGLCLDVLLLAISYFVAASAISGMTAIIVTQLKVAPLRPVDIKAAFMVLKRRWRPFLRTAIRVTLRIVFGWLLVVPGIIATVRYALYAPVVLMEGLEKKPAMRRARELASRSWRTVMIVVFLQFLIPTIFSLIIGRIGVSVGQPRPKPTLGQQIYQQVLGLMNIFVVPLMSIVPALLYLKMRELGGERFQESAEQLEEDEVKHSEWQRRMRTRLTGSSYRPTRSQSGSGQLHSVITGGESVVSKEHQS